jgi:hypothetical protein
MCRPASGMSSLLDWIAPHIGAAGSSRKRTSRRMNRIARRPRTVNNPAAVSDDAPGLFSLLIPVPKSWRSTLFRYRFLSGDPAIGQHLSASIFESPRAMILRAVAPGRTCCPCQQDRRFPSWPDEDAVKRSCFIARGQPAAVGIAPPVRANPILLIPDSPAAPAAWARPLLAHGRTVVGH